MPTDPTYQYTIEDIRRYLSGSMSSAEMHDMEKAALSDPFLADALDGYGTATPAVTDMHLNEIRGRISGQKVETTRRAPVVALHRTKWWRGLAAAAVIGIMAAGAWFFMRPDAATTGQIAGNTPLVTAPVSRPSTDSATVQSDRLANTAVESQQLPPTAAEKKAQQPDIAKKSDIRPNAPLPQAAAASTAVADNAAAAPALEEAAAIQPAAPTPQATALNAADSPIRIRGVRSMTKTAPAKENGFMMTGPLEQYYIGKVTDKSGIPIPGVTITAPQNHSTISNVDGSFRLPAQDSAGNLAFTAPGYMYKMQQLMAGKTAGIQLSQADSSLSDVVVVGYGQQKKRALTSTISSYKVDTLPYKESPYPQGGWDSFYNNLSNEMGINKGNASKDLHLRFTVENGLPEKFTVLKTPDEATAQKAISIIRKGPKWKTSKRKKKVDVKIKVD
ncbi:hypothetical protein LL912_06980 [Niabella sp. CC-SYL272]|uniref:carboxypeptidase regulatory-like domain-containing protein n=1 Tax=Niabella agricola TaxID=2891571 RepID=UPI001F19E0CF|nr:carboxypeptidase regulatory-like domain-containing protein [Niabella agricola]MCF3108516.1 hypothetical protein [Niabella agricola]